MNILHLNTVDTGGAALAGIRLHNSLLNRKINSKFLYLFKSKKSSQNIYNYYNIAQLTPFQNFTLKLNEWLYYKKANRLKKNNQKPEFEIFTYLEISDFYKISKLKIFQEADIIHANWISNFASLNLLLKTNKKIVWTLHDMNPFTGGCHYSMGCSQFEANCNNCPQLVDKNIAINNLKKKISAINQSNKNNLTLVFPSNWLMNLSKKSNLFKGVKHFQIPNGLEANLFKPFDKLFARSVFKLPDKKKIILFVSENINNPRKGIKYLIEALSKINQNNEYILCSIGNPFEHKDIVNLGFITDSRLISIAYSAADVFVLPSIADNLPNVIVESLMCGTPVISFPVGGINEMIENGINGMLCKDISEESLASTIENFFMTYNSFNRSNISALAIEKYNVEKITENYINIYNQLMK